MSIRTRFRHVALALAVALPLAAPAVARAQGGGDRPAIAVLPLDNAALTQHAEYAALSSELADQLSAELGRGGARVIDRARVQQALQQQQLGSRTRFDTETAARLGKALGARWVVVGSYAVDMRGRMRVDARAVNTETGAADHTVSITEQATDRAKLVAAAAREMSAGLKLQ